MTDKKQMTADEMVESLRAEVTRLTFPSENGGSVPRVLNSIKKALVAYAEQQAEPLVEALEFYALGMHLTMSAAIEKGVEICHIVPTDKGEVANKALTTYQNQREKRELSDGE